MKVAMLLLAAGRGSRFGGPLPKAYLHLRGRPLIVHSAERLLQAVAGDAHQLLVVVHPQDRTTHLTACLPELERLCVPHGSLRIVDGGSSRQESMQRGLAAADADASLVVIHDAARALVPVAAVRDCITTAARVGAALLAIPATDTQKQVADGMVTATLERAGVWLAQTPQVIRRDLLLRALENAHDTGFEGTDDVSLIERLGLPVAVVHGSPTNLKITQPADLALAEAILTAGLP